MPREATIMGQRILLAEPIEVPVNEHFVGRSKELDQCCASWGVDLNEIEEGQETVRGFRPDMYPLHFRLQGPPGAGKNELVYEIARKLKLPLYVMQGHEELSPEDLSLILVPEPQSGNQQENPTPAGNDLPLVPRASPLATAIYEGGLFFFDEINRVPERALALLASVLDDRRYIDSALVGIRVEPKDATAASRFRFCSALNPRTAETHVGELPDYIAERTLPVIPVSYPMKDEMLQIIRSVFEQQNLQDSGLLEEFETWYSSAGREREVSVREALSVMRYAMNFIKLQVMNNATDAFQAATAQVHPDEMSDES